MRLFGGMVCRRRGGLAGAAGKKKESVTVVLEVPSIRARWSPQNQNN